MLNLILKDILIQKKSFLYALCYGVFIFFVFPVSLETRYIMGIVAIAYIFISTANQLDDKNKSDVVLNSIPIKRQSIVIAKFFSVGVFYIIGLVTMGVMGAMINIIGTSSLRLINSNDILFSLLCVGLLASIYHPIYFKFGHQGSRILSMFLFLAAFFIPNFLINYLGENEKTILVQRITTLVNDSSWWMFGSLMMLLLLMALLVSAGLSVRVYRNREF